MSGRDDMIMRPTIGPIAQPTAAVRARADRQVDANRDQRSGLIQRMARLRRQRSMVRAARGRARMRRAAQAGTGIARTAKTASMFGRAASLGNPVSAGLTALLVAGLVALRLGTGRPLEGIGAEINKVILGDLDEEARAKTSVRTQLQGDSNIARIMGQENVVNAQITKVSKDLYDVARREEIGRTALFEAMPVNNLLDNLILRAASALQTGWERFNGPANMERFESNYKASRTGGVGGTFR
jgi:hypothetical protein